MGLVANDQNPYPVDRHIGSRVRKRRIALGITQSALAKRIGVTYQQVQKYEKGINRISADRLQAIADALSLPFTSFFDGAPRQV